MCPSEFLGNYSIRLTKHWEYFQRRSVIVWVFYSQLPSVEDLLNWTLRGKLRVKLSWISCFSSTGASQITAGQERKVQVCKNWHIVNIKRLFSTNTQCENLGAFQFTHTYQLLISVVEMKARATDCRLEGAHLWLCCCYRGDGY